ncbi:restriction endonuclease subunit S [Microcoleus sp. MON1_C5]|uniref:restriction endonuclease subunit S n=1 Tax=Microcoleus sp. MON1_C5 TaxID=2818828 RepID=UPI002FCEB581
MRVESANFPTKNLRETLTEICYGTSTPPTFFLPSVDTVPFVRATDIKEGQIQLENLLHISSEQPPKMDKCLLSGGEVIVVRSGANTGDSAFIPYELAGAYAAYDLILKFKNTINPKFVAYFLDTEIGRLQLNLVRGRSAQPHVNAEEVSEIRIVLPDLNKQVELVAAMDKARSQRKQKLAKADALLSSLDKFILDTLNFRLPPPDNRKVYATTLSQMIGERIDPYSNKPYFQKLFNAIQNSPHNVLTLINLSIRIFSGTTPLAKGEAYVDPPNGVRFIRSGEITTEGTVTPTSEVHISDEIHTGKMKSSQLQKGDLLIAIVGATIGAVGIYNLDEPANINQAIASVRLSNNEVLGEYICWYLRSSIGQRLLDYFKRPVARANINLAEVGEIPIIIPDLQIQETVLTEVYNRRSEAQRLRSEAETGWQAAKQWFEDQLLGGS